MIKIFTKGEKLMNRVDVAYSLIVDENEENILMVKNIKHNNWSPPGGG